MRYTWIDGLYTEVKRCWDCPFYSEWDVAGECRYPLIPAKEDLEPNYDFRGRCDGVAPDCPLRTKD